MMDKCKCTMSIRLLGDGCRHCQPQTYIDSLEDTVDQLVYTIEELEEEIRERGV
jgi:hypothetical protein